MYMYVQADRSNCPEPHGFSFNTAANSMIKVKMKKNDSYKPEDNDYIAAVVRVITRLTEGH